MKNPLPSREEIARLPPDGGPRFNRLIHEQSPYLLQHAANPVDWYPWGEEAFARAAREDKPVFLSVGYSTCHWCHVMERESFENPDTAALLNALYVPVKVDREERPDLDELYMHATQLLTGQGGWPNSVWLLPDGRPWFAGTYFPPEDRYGRAGFPRVLASLAELWRTRRADVEEQAAQLTEAVRSLSSRQPPVPTGGFDAEDLIARAVEQLRGSFDPRHGGFGGAPKFPPHGAIEVLFFEYEQHGDRSLLDMALATLDAIALGGIHDHLGGGFHRYSTDAQWKVPHFEKMLYDNAQLAGAFARGFRIAGREWHRRAALDCCGWVLREMTHPEGPFYSALDADSEGEEGKFYLWSATEITDVLVGDDADLFRRVYQTRPSGNFLDEATGRHTGDNILHLREPIPRTAEALGMNPAELESRLGQCRARLLERRAGRPRPHLDDKILTGWNGLMIGALACAGRELGVPEFITAAEKAAGFIVKRMGERGKLLHTWREGTARIPAYQDDHAFLADGLLDLYESTRKKHYLDEARRRAEVMLADFRDPGGGGLFYTSAAHENLLLRSRDFLDKAVPSGNGMAARVLLRLGRWTGDESFHREARAILSAFAPLMRQFPRGTESLLLAAAMEFEYTREIGSNKVEGGPSDTAPDAAVEKPPVRAEVYVSHTTLAPGARFWAVARIEIAPGWHLSAPDGGSETAPPPFRIAIASDGPFLQAGTISYPAAKQITLGAHQHPVAVYEDKLALCIPLATSDDAQPGEATLRLQIHVQACDAARCLAPETLEPAVAMRIVPGAAAAKPRHAALFGRMGIAADG